MIGFINELNLIELGESLNNSNKIIYELNEDLIFIYNDLEIIIPKGFQTDLASVPRIPFIYDIWGDRAYREAVLHDYLYRKDSIPIVSKDIADYIFKQAMISRKQPFYIYYPMYLGVVFFGNPFYHRLDLAYKYSIKNN